MTALEIPQWKILSLIMEETEVFSVYLAENIAEGKRYAITLTSEHYENDILSKLNHDSIIQHQESININELSFSNQEDQELFKSHKFGKGCAMECPSRGDLLGLIRNLNIIPEIVARSYTSQLFSALEHLHTQRVAHRDLTLKSLLLDDNFCLKLANFGVTEIIPEGKLSTGKVGTEKYFAPEILLNGEYDAFSADMFALGVIIFELVSGYSPFSQASEEDEFYAMIKEERWEEFWMAHEEIDSRNPILARSCLKELIESLLCPNPERRATISDVRDSKWLKIMKLEKMQVKSWIVEIAKKQKSILFDSSA